jgi:phenylalanyl-tRNA synthetase alpha chain
VVSSPSVFITRSYFQANSKQIAVMALADFLAELDRLAAEGAATFAQATDAGAAEAARVEFLGAKSGRLKAAQKGLGTVEGPDKPAAGKRFNEVKVQLEAALAAAQERVGGGSSTEAVSDGPIFDPTLPGGREFQKGRYPYVMGHLHPLTQTIEELKDIMGRLGFTVADGPEIEDEWHNFEALNIPASHPARDPLENFYLATANVGRSGPMLLRSQTSTVQIRVMEKQKPPVRIISLGRVYRPDDADATHYPMFHQIEGLLIDRNVTMADLKSVLRLFAASFLGHDVHIRFRPSFFPFTEPSVEVDMAWETVGGKTRYVEMGGAGMVDPNVLRAVGYDPEEVTGFAFGLGVERVCARRHGVADIREFYRNDVRFLRQF